MLPHHRATEVGADQFLGFLGTQWGDGNASWPHFHGEGHKFLGHRAGEVSLNQQRDLFLADCIGNDEEHLA